MVADAILYVPEQAPFIGNLIQAKRRGFGSAEPPLIRTASLGIEGAVNLFREGKRRKGAEQLTEAAMTLYFGRPGTAQAFDLYEAWAENNK